MTLLELRTEFRKRSGRFDLVNADFSDNGADFFIQAGVRVLDRMITHIKSSATSFGAIASGAFKYTFTNCRAIKEVWISDASERTQLRLLSPIEFYQNYAAPASQITGGRPAYYTPINLRATDIAEFESLAQFLQYVTVADETYNGVVFNPADTDYVIEIIGLFDSKDLSDDADTNFWSVNFPDILLMAALYKLEVFHRNQKGAEDWMVSIMREIQTIELDMIEQDDQLEDMR